MSLFAVLLAVVFEWFAPSKLQRYIFGWWWIEDIRGLQEGLPWRFHYKDETVDPELTSLNIKMMLLQLLGSFLTFSIVSSGGKATRIFENEVPHVLVLKKAELQVAGLPTVRSLLYSFEVELEIWCRLPTELEPEPEPEPEPLSEEDGAIDTAPPAKVPSLRKFLIDHNLHEVVARAAVRHLHPHASDPPPPFDCC